MMMMAARRRGADAALALTLLMCASRGADGLELLRVSPTVRGLLERGEPDVLDYQPAVAEAPPAAASQIDGTPHTAPPKLVRLNVGLEGGRSEAVLAHDGDDLESIANAFCASHGLDTSKAAPTIVNGLRDLLARARQMTEPSAPETAREPTRFASLRAGLRLPPVPDASSPVGPTSALLDVQGSDGELIGTVVVLPSVPAAQTAANFVASHAAAHPELAAYGAEQLAHAIGALGTAVRVPPLG